MGAYTRLSAQLEISNQVCLLTLLVRKLYPGASSFPSGGTQLTTGYYPWVELRYSLLHALRYGYLSSAAYSTTSKHNRPGYSRLGGYSSTTARRPDLRLKPSPRTVPGTLGRSCNTRGTAKKKKTETRSQFIAPMVDFKASTGCCIVSQC